MQQTIREDVAATFRPNRRVAAATLTTRRRQFPFAFAVVFFGPLISGDQLLDSVRFGRNPMFIAAAPPRLEPTRTTGPVTIVLGVGGADSLVPVVIGEGTITLPIGYTVGVATRLP